MTKITSVVLADMFARRQRGETVAEIAVRFNVKPGSIYQKFNRDMGGTPLPGPANDNHPDRVTRMTPHNGGCSSTSGKMPVTLQRVPTLDGAVEESRAAA